MKTIKVTGKGMIRLRPDTTRITITITGIYPEYSETIRHSSEDTESLKDIISDYGFERQDLKTLSFDVDAEYENYEENGIYKQRMVGYRYRHLLKIEFDSDNERLGKILYALGNSELNPEIRLSYTVKDQEKAKNTLLGNAVNDAKEKAAVIASAAGVSIKDIQNIDYSWGEIDFEVRPMNRTLMKACAVSSDSIGASSYGMDIEPDDITVSDTVTVIWEIS